MKTAVDDDAAASVKLMADEPVVIDDMRWAEVLDITDGAAALCFQCGVCTAACPWGLVREETFSVRTLIRDAQLGLDRALGQMWLCTTCGECEAYCPRGVKIGDVVRGLRSLAWSGRHVPHGLPTVMWSLQGNHNPWGQPPSTRSLWAHDLEIPVFDAGQHEILLYVGCTAAYDRRIQDVARALVTVLRAAGVSFGYLGDDEPCCGESALSLGHEPFFTDLMHAASSLLRQQAVSRLVTISPHCFDAFKKHLPVEEAEIDVLHYSQYLAQLVAEDRLRFNSNTIGRATFHDPCYLARRYNDCTSARAVLDATPGIELAEMAHRGPETICCGGGGGRMWLETAPDERFADIRIGEAVEAGADFLITACPFCLACLEDSQKALRHENLQVLDLAEVLSRSLSLEA
jgi:Fe-S oxidoreductase